VRQRGEDANKPGETYLEFGGSYPTLHRLLTGLFEKKLRASDAETVSQLRDDVIQAVALVERAVESMKGIDLKESGFDEGDQ